MEIREACGSHQRTRGAWGAMAPEAASQATESGSKRGSKAGPAPFPFCTTHFTSTPKSPPLNHHLFSSSPLLLLLAVVEHSTEQEIIMECVNTSFTRNLGWKHNYVYPSKMISGKQWIPRMVACFCHASANSCQHLKFTSMMYPLSPVYGRRSSWRSFAASVNLEEGPPSSSSEQSSDSSEIVHAAASGKVLPRQLNSAELKSLLADSERSKLMKKLSEANQYNRFLKRQLQIRDDTLAKFKSELAVLELELQALVGLAEEIANFDVPPGSRKINGKYIHSHLLSRLEAVHNKVKEEIKDVDSLKSREITVYWVGMAECVQIMGSFDGWTQGEEMSPEYSGDYARFSVTLKLRPGRYEIKFLVDGEWKLSPEFPIIGEGMLQNNLLIVG